MSMKYRPDNQCAKKIHVLNSNNEAIQNLTIVDDVLTLGAYGSYTYFFTLVDYPDIMSREGSFTLVEPVVIVQEDTKTYDLDVTLEQITLDFNLTDANSDRELTLDELLAVYQNLVLKDGLKTVLKKLIIMVDKNQDERINYSELFKKEEKKEKEKSTFAGVVIKEEQSLTP